MFNSCAVRRSLYQLFFNNGFRCVHNLSTSNVTTAQINECSDYAQQFYNSNPKLSKYGLESVVTFYRNFEKSSLPRNNVGEVIKGCPDLLKVPSGRMSETLESWISFGFGEDFLMDLLETHPSVLFLSRNHLEKKYSLLTALLPTKHLFKLILKAPLVLTEPGEMTQSKLKYMENVMKYSIKEIVSYGALNFSLDHLKTRFEFMIRCGIFKVPKPKTQEIDKPLNPPLSNVLSFNDYDFATKIVGVSDFEFRVFKEMIRSKEDSDLEDDDILVEAS